MGLDEDGLCNHAEADLQRAESCIVGLHLCRGSFTEDDNSYLWLPQDQHGHAGKNLVKVLAELQLKISAARSKLILHSSCLIGLALLPS